MKISLRHTRPRWGQRYRVLHLIDHLGSGGAQETLLNLVKYADRRQFHPEVATLHGQGHYWKALGALGIPVYSLSGNKFLPLYVPRLFRLLLQGKYDIIHCHLPAANLLGKPLAALCGVPRLLNHDQTHDIYRYTNKIRGHLDRWANRFADHIVAASASIRDYLMREQHQTGEKISVIYNGVDLERFSPEGDPAHREKLRLKWQIPQDRLVVLGVGRLCYQKNFPLFLRIAFQVARQQPEALFLVAGEGPDIQALKHLRRSLELEKQVRFLGFVEDMRELYALSDVLLLPSRFEGTPLTILEALAMGLPPVASRIDGIAEVLEDGRDSFLVAPEDEIRFSNCVLRLLNDRALARGFGRAGMKKAASRYAAAAMTRQVEDLYLRCLHQDRGR